MGQPVEGQSHYFSPHPVGRSNRREVELALPDRTLGFTTDNGVFSPDKIDVGTRYLLLDGPEPVTSDRVLVDLGAGYGPIACAIAARNPEAEVWAVEVNERARALCAENARANGLVNVKVLDPGEIPAHAAVDRIWSNPPIRVGKDVLHGLLTAWLVRLQPEGSAHLVVHKHLGSDSLQSWLGSEGWRVERRQSRKGYRLLDVAPQLETPG